MGKEAGTRDESGSNGQLINGRGLLTLARGGSLLFLASVALTMTTRRQVSDDWTFAVWLRQKGLLGILPYGYTHFTGRIPLLLFGGLLSSWPLAIALAIPVATLIPATWGVRSLLARVGIESREASAFAALLVIGVVAGAPARNQAVFWPIGALVYVIPAVFFICTLTVLLSRTRRAASLIGGALSAFAAASGNEIQAVVVPFTLIAIVIAQTMKRNQPGRRWIDASQFSQVLSAVFGGLALIAAPGNGGRSKMMMVTVKHDAVTVLSSAKTVFYVLQINLLAAGLLPAATIVVAGILAGRRIPDKRLLLSTSAIIAALSAVVSVLTFCFVSAWGFNASAPLRSMFPVWLCCAAALFCSSAKVGAGQSFKGAHRVRAHGPGIAGFALMALAAPGFAAATVVQALPRDRAIARQLDCIERTVRFSGAEGTTIASPQQADSLLILEDNPKSTTNSAVSERFGAGPVTRVNPGTNAQCEAEATELVRFVRPSDFGPPVPAG